MEIPRQLLPVLPIDLYSLGIIKLMVAIMNTSISSMHISFIRPFTLPNFVDKLQNLNKEFDFLSNSNDYSQYYKDMESLSGNKKNFNEFKEIPNIGRLIPLRKKHTLNSYWQYFRLTLKNQEKKGKTNNELFLLMPIKIDFGGTSIRAHDANFPYHIYAYLFPFGSCCINMDINIKGGYSIDELSELIKDIKRSVIIDGLGFEAFSLKISRILNQELFGGGDDVIPFSTHTLIFVDDIPGIILSASYDKDKHSIIALMTGKSVSDVSTMKEDAINNFISCKLKNHRLGEILFFNRSMSTFIYPSPSWRDELQKKGKNYKLKCMRSNYQSFLNVIFAVNRFLEDSFLKNKAKLPNNRSLEIKKCFTTAFPGIPLNNSSRVYFGVQYEQIAEQIGLNGSIKKL